MEAEASAVNFLSTPKSAEGLLYKYIPSAATEALPIAAVLASVFAVNIGRVCPWALACVAPKSAAQAIMMMCFEFILVVIIV